MLAKRPQHLSARWIAYKQRKRVGSNHPCLFSYALALLRRPQSWCHCCRRVVNFQYDANTRRDWRRKQESWPGSWGKSIHNPGITAQGPFRRASVTTSRPNEPLKPQLISLGEAKFQVEGGGLLPSRPRLHRHVWSIPPTVSAPRKGARQEAGHQSRPGSIGCWVQGRHVLRLGVARCDSEISIPIPIPVLGRLIQAFDVWHRSTRTI